jgi:cellulose synthase/poly-beta-1,6-N-acetylglucosamine synthase-like glycosyltransferase
MGYERKRGKLADLNATLRGSENRFSVMVGDLESLQRVRYVITLDSDTQLPFDAARKMIEAMSHPLNRPVPNESGKGIAAGYTILQPRVGVSPKSSQKSWFVRLFGEPGIDPYTRLVSDLYQDLFQEGSFIGKGIYDVDAFEKYCGNFPENAILSHDLLEGCYARSAVISDVILYEDFPSSYAVDAGRRHRWIRGDWQIAGWLAPRVRQSAMGRGRNPLSALSCWKIFDNLRRSLMPIAILILLTIGWLALPPSGGILVTLFVLTMLATPHILPAIVDLFNKPSGVPVMAHFAVAMQAITRHLFHALYAIVFIQIGRAHV